MKDISFFFIGDLHYKESNLDDQAVLANEILAHIDSIRSGCSGSLLDVIITLGDELDVHNPPANVKGACVTFLRKLKDRCKYLIILVGNHTRKNNKISIGPDHALADVSHGGSGTNASGSGDVIFVEDPMLIEIMGFRIGALPYCNPSDFVSIFFEKFPAPGDMGIDFFIGHQEFYGVELTPGQVSTCSAGWDPSWPPIICGHIHGRSIKKNILYPGTPIQHSVSESIDKYVYMMQIAPGTHPFTPGCVWEHFNDGRMSGYKYGGIGGAEPDFYPSPDEAEAETQTTQASVPSVALREIQIMNAPKRYRIGIDITQLDGMYDRIMADINDSRAKTGVENYYYVHITYSNHALINGSWAYNALKANVGRLKLSSELLADRTVQASQSSSSGLSLDYNPTKTFVDYMREQLYNLKNGNVSSDTDAASIARIISTAGGWTF